MGRRRGQIHGYNERVLRSAGLAIIDAVQQPTLSAARSDRLSACKLTRGPQRSHLLIPARDGGASEDKGNLP